jgi:hypothetical protein
MDIWLRLVEELDRWSDDGKTATFWWRDDDAVAPSSQLELLLAHAQSIPLALSVIPGSVTPDLAERLRDVRSVVVLQHGWLHRNYVAAGRSEFPSSRSEQEVARDLAEGRRRLSDLFGEQAIAAFVPPWHMFDDCFLPLLSRNGLAWISRKGPRPSLYAAPDLLQVNAHVAPIRWSVPPDFDNEAESVLSILDHLRGRRTGQYDAHEPTGLLTHHLVQNARSYKFISRLITVTAKHPAGAWIGARDFFRSVQGGNEVGLGAKFRK